MSHFSVIHWSSLKHKKHENLNVSGHVAPSEKHIGSLMEGFTQTQVSTLAVKDKMLVAGGFQGELICKVYQEKGMKDNKGYRTEMMEYRSSHDSTPQNLQRVGLS